MPPQPLPRRALRLQLRRYEKYTTAKEPTAPKTGDQFTQAYTELVDRINDLSLVSAAPMVCLRTVSVQQLSQNMDAAAQKADEIAKEPNRAAKAALNAEQRCGLLTISMPWQPGCPAPASLPASPHTAALSALHLCICCRPQTGTEQLTACRAQESQGGAAGGGAPAPAKAGAQGQDNARDHRGPRGQGAPQLLVSEPQAQPRCWAGCLVRRLVGRPCFSCWCRASFASLAGRCWKAHPTVVLQPCASTLCKCRWPR